MMANLYRDVLINQYNEMAILVKITKSLGIEVSEMKLNKNIYNNECILDDYSNISQEKHGWQKSLLIVNHFIDH